MKNRRSQIQKQVERTLGCFETAERLEPDPWFASRVRSRIAGREPVSPSFRWSLTTNGPITSALLALMLVANLVSVVVLSQQRNRQGASPKDDVSSLALAYGYAARETSYYLSTD
ncbi:MAG: hypothetical protein IIC50_12090 [Planctomycetes bacterium]|nr:hypothetical protein [Planctomycetota bacterium]